MSLLPIKIGLGLTIGMLLILQCTVFFRAETPLWLSIWLGIFSLALCFCEMMDRRRSP